MEIVRNKINFKLNDKERFAIELVCEILCKLSNTVEEENVDVLRYWSIECINDCVDLLNDVLKESL
jgi:hypothetical protein